MPPPLMPPPLGPFTTALAGMPVSHAWNGMAAEGLTGWLGRLTLIEATAFFAVVNVLIVGLSAGANTFMRRLPGVVRLSGRDQPLTRSDGWLTTAAVVVNVAASILGWSAWKAGWLPLRSESLPAFLVTLIAMTAVMDLGLYAGHRVAHWPPIYRLIHARHHQHRDTNPLSLFVLHPVEVVGFAALLLAGILMVTPTPLALQVYLFLNILFGTLGHADVQIGPSRLARHPLLRWLGLSDFHLGHHHHENTNFGFYTRVWDRIFGTEATKRPTPIDPAS